MTLEPDSLSSQGIGAYTPTDTTVLSATISDTSTPDSPGLVYSNPSVPPSTIAGQTVGAGGRLMTGQTSPNQGFQTKQIVIYNDPNGARQALSDLGLAGTLIDYRPIGTSS